MSELVPNFVLLLLHLSYEIKTFSKINNYLFFSWGHFMYFLVVVLVKLTEEYRHLLYPGRIRTRVSHGRPKIDIKIDVHMWFSVLCMFNIHKCIIHHINQNFSADAKMYHTCVYVEHTWSYDHICTQFWRSFSGSAAIINLPLKILDTEW